MIKSNLDKYKLYNYDLLKRLLTYTPMFIYVYLTIDISLHVLSFHTLSLLIK